MRRLRHKIAKRASRSHVPILVYLVVLVSMALLWYYRHYDEELAMNFFAELFGAAFTLFIIDVLLVRSKRKRWTVVSDEINYLVARSVHRIRDGLSVRVFNFDPKISDTLSLKAHLEEVGVQRTALLQELEHKNVEEITSMINKESLFSDRSYTYFNEKADEIWLIVNNRYTDYFDPELISYLIRLSMNLKDLCSHIRQFQKSDRYRELSNHYENIGIEGAAITLIKVINVINDLKEEGYSERVSLDGMHKEQSR